MSIQDLKARIPMTETTLKDPLTTDQVAAWLRQHPFFLRDHPEVVASQMLASSPEGTTPLGLWQIQRLRAKSSLLEQRMGELIDIAAENERVMKRVHALVVGMLHAETPRAAIGVTMGRMRGDFAIEEVRLVLFDMHLDLHGEVGVQSEPQGRAGWISQLGVPLGEEPVTVRLSAERRQRLFGEAAAMVRSTAILPLGEWGALLLGSHSSDHFHPGMGTLFLDLLAAAFGITLERAMAGGGVTA